MIECVLSAENTFVWQRNIHSERKHHDQSIQMAVSEQSTDRFLALLGGRGADHVASNEYRGANSGVHAARIN
jgi:hypothetical protein